MPAPIVLFAWKAFSFLGVIKSAIAKAATAVFTVAVKYPIQTGVLVAMLVGAYFLYNWAYDRGHASRNPEVAQLQKVVEDYKVRIEENNKTIARLESYSGILANAIKNTAQQLRTDLKALTDTYEKNLAEARKDPKVITKVVEVKVPGEERVIEVMVQNGNVVCDRYPEGYSSTVNQMVSKTREAMRKGLPNE